MKRFVAALGQRLRASSTTARMMVGLTFLCAALVVVFPTPTQAAGEPKTVLILHSYGQNFKPWSEYAKSLRQELERRSSWPLILQDFSVVTARADEENAEPQFVEYLRALFVRRSPDLIVAFGAPGGAFVQRHRAELFPTTPMVLTAIDHRRVQATALTENDAVVAVRLDIPILFGNILQLLPDTKTVNVVVGNSPNERFWIEQIQKELRPLADRLSLHFYNDLPFEDILKQAASLPPNNAIFWNQLQVDSNGAVHEGDRALKELYSVANAPIFSYDDSFFTGEIVGGPMTSVSEGARTTADVALRILAGDKPSTIKIPILQLGPAKYDWRELRRWGISEARLAPGSEVQFREVSLWHNYWWQISLIATTVILQAGLITFLLHERRRRVHAEIQARQRMSELTHVNRYAMAGELTTAVAHELNQPLGAILTNAETLELMLGSPAPDMNEIKEVVADIRRDDERASKVLLRLRSLLKKAPFEIKSVDLNEIIRESIGLLSAIAHQRQVEVRSSIGSGSLPVMGDRIQLQQIIMNMMVNAMDALADISPGERTITISSTRVSGSAEVSIADSGPGLPDDKIKQVFEPFYTTKKNGMGMGLSIARTIVEAHGGRIWAENEPSGGAIFRVRLPSG